LIAKASKSWAVFSWAPGVWENAVAGDRTPVETNGTKETVVGNRGDGTRRRKNVLVVDGIETRTNRSNRRRIL
jgi:hypothetical protein